MQSCAHIVLDTADIVRDGDFSTVTKGKLANGNMNDYVSGGYYVVKTISRPSGLSDILPTNLLTMSDCFTSVVREIIQLQWDDYANVSESIAEEASEFGIPESRISELVSWAKEQQNTNYVVYSDIGPALELAGRFITDRKTHVVGIGLHNPP